MCRGNIVRGFPRGGTHVLNTSSGLTSNVLSVRGQHCVSLYRAHRLPHDIPTQHVRNADVRRETLLRTHTMMPENLQVR